MEVFSHHALAELHPTWGHPERPERLAVLLQHFPDAVPGRTATVDEIARCHDRGYIAAVESIDRPLWVEPNTIGSETTYEAALLAAGTAIEAVLRGGFALVRPPGHHAPRDTAFGFCFFNNAAVAVRAAQAELGLKRVAVVDFDVHHGNGTQAIFWDDDDVLYVSLHQYGAFFPGTGGPDEQRETTLNVPMPAGAGDREWLEAFERVVEPRLRAFDAELVVASAGFDGHEEEELYLTETRLSDAAFREMARRCAAHAPRVAAVLEGGYNLATLPRLVQATLEGLVM